MRSGAISSFAERRTVPARPPVLGRLVRVDDHVVGAEAAQLGQAAVDGEDVRDGTPPQ